MLDAVLDKCGYGVTGDLVYPMMVYPRCCRAVCQSGFLDNSANPNIVYLKPYVHGSMTGIGIHGNNVVQALQWVEVINCIVFVFICHTPAVSGTQPCHGLRRLLFNSAIKRPISSSQNGMTP